MNDGIFNCVVNPLDVIVGGAHVHVRDFTKVTSNFKFVECLVSSKWCITYTEVTSNSTSGAENALILLSKIAREATGRHEFGHALSQEGDVNSHVVGVVILENAYIN